MRSGPAPSGHTSASLVHHQYSSSVSPFQAKTAAPRGLAGVPPRPTATAAAAVSCVLKMLHEAQRTSAPRSISVSISTAVCTVMCSEPVMRAPPSGLAAAYRARSAMSPGISCSARRISLRPSSASARSFTLQRGRAARAGATDVSFVVVLIEPSSAPGGAPEPARRAQVADAVGALPAEVRALGDAPEVAVGGGALVDGALQPEHVDDGRGLQVEHLAHHARDLLVRHGAGAEGVDQHGHRVRDADRVRELHLAALRQLRRHDVLGDVARHVGGAPVDLRGVLAAERAAAVPPVAAVGVDDDLPAGEAAVAPGLALGDALRDVERLPLDRRHDGAAVAVEAALRGVADVADHLLRDLAEFDPRLARDLAGDDHETGLDERLAGDAAVRVFGEQRIEDGVRDLVADLVRVALVDRFRREDVVLQHGWRIYPMLVGRGERAPRGRRATRAR